MAKHYKAAAVLTACIFSAAAGVTCAYLIADDSAENTLNGSKVETTIVEEFEPEDDPGPGSVIKKIPKIHSDSNVACYVRAMVQFTNDGDKLCEPLEIREGWTLNADGYFYWKEPLPPGEDTGALFDLVKLRTDIDAEDIQPFDILVYAEAVQAKGMEADQAWAAMDGGQTGR